MAATAQRAGRWYTSREAAKSFAGIAAAVTDKDAKIDAIIAQVSVMIERHTDRRFIPVTTTKEFDYQGSSQLILGDDLVSVSTLSKDGTAIAVSDFFLYPLNAADDNKPYTWIELLFTSQLFDFSDTKQSAITIAGKFGYSEFTRTLSTLSAAITDAAATSMTVTSGSDFDIGQTLLIDSEQLFVRNISGTTVTVDRGQNGTTAATHLNAAAVKAIDPPPDIALACNGMVARFMHRADAAWSDRAGDQQSGFTYYKGIPADLKAILDYYRRVVYPAPRLMQRMGSAGRYGMQQAGE